MRGCHRAECHHSSMRGPRLTEDHAIAALRSDELADPSPGAPAPRRLAIASSRVSDYSATDSSGSMVRSNGHAWECTRRAGLTVRASSDHVAEGAVAVVHVEPGTVGLLDARSASSPRRRADAGGSPTARWPGIPSEARKPLSSSCVSTASSCAPSLVPLAAGDPARATGRCRRAAQSLVAGGFCAPSEDLGEPVNTPLCGHRRRPHLPIGRRLNQVADPVRTIPRRCCTSCGGPPTDSGYLLFCLAGPRAPKHPAMFRHQARLTWTVEADSHFEAMTRYYEHQGWGVYHRLSRRRHPVPAPSAELR